MSDNMRVECTHDLGCLDAPDCEVKHEHYQVDEYTMYSNTPERNKSILEYIFMQNEEENFYVFYHEQTSILKQIQENHDGN